MRHYFYVVQVSEVRGVDIPRRKKTCNYVNQTYFPLVDLLLETFHLLMWCSVFNGGPGYI
jgi:hypothetical protein